MSAYHLLAKRAYANHYGGVSPLPTLGVPEWQSAPGLKAPTTSGLGQRLWQSKGEIAGNLGGWSAGAAAGAAIGAPFGGIGAIPGAMIGSVIGGLAGSTLGGWGGEQADNAMTAQAAKGQPYRPPVTDMASYGANMLAQGMDENRKRISQ